MAGEDDPFGQMQPPADWADGTDRPRYRPAVGRGRKWLGRGFAVAIVVALAAPLLHLCGVPLWPRNPDAVDAVALRNKHGGPAGVYHTQRVTPEDARRVGEILVGADVFGGPAGADVLLDREGGSVVVSYFIEKGAPLDEFEAELRPVRDRLSAEVFGGEPVTIALCERGVRVFLDKVNRTVLRKF